VYRAAPLLQRLMRTGIYWARETFVVGFTKERRIMRLPERLSRRHLRRQVPDAELRRRLAPKYTLGCKRVLISNDYYPTLTRPNVEVVTDGIREIRERSIVTADGAERPVDTIIFGTGFHVTDMPAARQLRGRDGVLLADAWQGSPQAYLGTTIAGFPNLFMLIGPNTGLGHTSMVFMIESQLAYVLDALRTMERRGLATVEVRAEAQAAYNAELQRDMRGTVWTAGGCASWYLDEHGRNSTLWPGFTFSFRQRTRRFDAERYELRADADAPAAAAAALTGSPPR
jgi:cation diffusion facilitator CzcD-associated flavoprotein CzcO